MGFNKVYQTLKELFPQVDARLLKAVAIEHSKDPDVAVEAILTDVLPFIGDNSDVSASPAVKNDGETIDTCVGCSSTPGQPVGDDANGSSVSNEGHNFDSDSLCSSFYDANDNTDQLSANNKKEELTSIKPSEETGIQVDPCENISVTCGNFNGECSKDNHSQTVEDREDVSEDGKTDLHISKTADALSSLQSGEDSESCVISSNGQNVNQDSHDGILSDDSSVAPVFDLNKEKPPADWSSFACVVSALNACENQVPDALGCNTHLEAESTSPADANHHSLNSFKDDDLVQDFPVTDVTDASGAEGETVLSTIVTRSGQICKVNLLEDIMEEAKTYKDTVFTAMESVLGLMEEVEFQEKEAEHAKVAAAKGGLDILEKVEDIKRMLEHAKEANDMHAGEVYGEKSILATEVKELQARLFCLSDEKDKSLFILDEMRKSLEERLSVADEQRRAAEQEILEKQEIAQRALAEQELIMDKVVQESKMLQEEAEENAKLRDFLMEKGQAVDVLQGEISVICQDVRSLKENFDNRVSLRKSLSLEQTSCRLASSNSSVKSLTSVKSLASLRSNASLTRTASLQSSTSSKTATSDSTIEHFEFPESPARMSQTTSVDSQTPRSNVAAEVARSDTVPKKPLLDEDWELCDMNSF